MLVTDHPDVTSTVEDIMRQALEAGQMDEDRLIGDRMLKRILPLMQTAFDQELSDTRRFAAVMHGLTASYCAAVCYAVNSACIPGSEPALVGREMGSMVKDLLTAFMERGVMK